MKQFLINKVLLNLRHALLSSRRHVLNLKRRDNLRIAVMFFNNKRSIIINKYTNIVEVFSMNLQVRIKVAKPVVNLFIAAYFFIVQFIGEFTNLTVGHLECSTKTM